MQAAAGGIRRCGEGTKTSGVRLAALGIGSTGGNDCHTREPFAPKPADPRTVFVVDDADPCTLT